MLASYPGGPEYADGHATLIALIMVRRSLWMLVVDEYRGKRDDIDDHVRCIRQASSRLWARCGT